MGIFAELATELAQRIFIKKESVKIVMTYLQSTYPGMDEEWYANQIMGISTNVEWAEKLLGIKLKK